MKEKITMFDLNNLYRWSDAYGGGIVIADSLLDAQEKLKKTLGEDRDADKLIIWPWHSDDYYDEENPDVLDIYGG
jgi:hypothetical protein